MVIGGLDVILEKFEKKESIEKSLYKIMLESSSDDEIRKKMQNLGHSLDSIKQEMEQLRTDQPNTENLLGLAGNTVPPGKARRSVKGGR
jgi:hypothetical protein